MPQSPRHRWRKYIPSLWCSNSVDTGGAKGIRTPDLLNAIQTRYQLRYNPVMRRLYYIFSRLSTQKDAAFARNISSNFRFMWRSRTKSYAPDFPEPPIVPPPAGRPRSAPPRFPLPVPTRCALFRQFRHAKREGLSPSRLCVVDLRGIEPRSYRVHLRTLHA